MNYWPWLQISSVPLSASLCLDTEQTCEHQQGDWPCPALHRIRPQMEMAQTRSKGDCCPLTTKECRAARSENRSLLRPKRPRSPQLSACHSLSHEGDRAGCGPQTPKGFCILRNSRFVMSALFVVLILLCDLKLAMLFPSAWQFLFLGS